MSTRIELLVEETDEELVIRVLAPGLLPDERSDVGATVEGGVLEVHARRRVERIPGFHPEATPV